MFSLKQIQARVVRNSTLALISKSMPAASFAKDTTGLHRETHLDYEWERKVAPGNWRYEDRTFMKILGKDYDTKSE
jgi:hypothetical protein